MGAVIGLLHLKMGSDIGLTGIIINITAVGLTIFIMFLATNGQKGNTQSLESFVFPRVDLPLIKDVPVLRIISGHNILTYIAVLSIFTMRYVINKTRFGMRVRAVGSSPEAVSSVGLSVNKYKILAIGISGALAALGGVALSMAQVSFFSNNMTVGKGFVGLSASTMGVHPIGGALVAFMFGFVEAFGLKLQINHSVPIQLITMLPYLILIIALIISRYIKIKRRSRIRIRGKK